jgi:hypothetical protein
MSPDEKATKLTEIAALLSNCHCRYVPPDPAAPFQIKGGALDFGEGRYVVAHQDGPKLRFSCVWPCDYSRHNLYYPSKHDDAEKDLPTSITVSESRPSKVIAAELFRRLLPHYFFLFPRCQKRLEEAADWSTKTEANTRAIAALLDSSHNLEQRSKPDGEGSVNVHRMPGLSRVRVTATSVTFECFTSIPFEKGIRLLEFWKTLR